MAFGIFGSNPIGGFLHGVIAYLPLIFIALVIIIIVITAAAIAAVVRNLIENSLSGMPYANVLGNLAWDFIVALGIIAALNQLHIAQNVLNAVLYAALATLAGIAIVAVGGGAIRTMSQRWEAVAVRYDAESCASSAPGTRPASLTRRASTCPPIRAVPPTEQPARARSRPSHTPAPAEPRTGLAARDNPQVATPAAQTRPQRR